MYPDRTSNHYTYENTTSRLKTMTDAQGQSTNYTYFVDNNLQQVSYTNAIHATPSVSYTYDTNYNRLLTMSDGTGLTTYAYNPIASPRALGAGRLASIDGPLDNDTISYGYDELGHSTNRSIIFSAIIEEPGRFHHPQQLRKYSQLGITDRTSDNKPLGYQRLDRRGNHELKNLSYHAWRTACKSTTGPNAIKAFYQQSRLRTGSVRHARLNTQRKILETMWMMWLRRRPFDPKRFAQPTTAPGEQVVVKRIG